MVERERPRRDVHLTPVETITKRALDINQYIFIYM